MDQAPELFQGPIRPIARERRFDHRASRLPSAWIDSLDARVAPATGSAFDPLGGAAFERPLPADVAGPEGGPVVVMASRADSPALAAALQWAGQGTRTYLLTGADWTSKQAPRALLSCPRVLWRRVRHANLCALWHAQGAWIWLGEARSWWLALDTEQAEALRRSLVHQFWHEATEEGLLAEGSFTLRKPGQRPFDVADTGIDAPFRRVEAKATFEMPRGTDVQIHAPEGGVFAGPLHRLVVPPSGLGHAALGALVAEGARVGWDALDLPRLWVRPGVQGALRLPHPTAPAHLTLNAAQATALGDVLATPLRWRFETDVRLGSYAADAQRLWLADAKTARPLVSEQPLSAGTLTASALRTLGQTEPRPFPAPEPLALSSRVQWTAAPPTLPKGCAADPLAGQWQQLDQQQAQRVATLRDGVTEAEQEQKRLGNRFKQFAQAFFGFGHAKDTLKGQVEACAAPLASARGPAAARALFETLEKLEQRQAEHRKDLRDAENKARVDEAREAQQAEWTARVEKARQDQIAARQRQRETTEAHGAQADALEQAQATLRAAEEDKSERETAVRGLAVDESAARSALAVANATPSGGGDAKRRDQRPSGKTKHHKGQALPKERPAAETDPELAALAEAEAQALAQAEAAAHRVRERERLTAELADLSKRLDAARRLDREQGQRVADARTGVRRAQDDLARLANDLKRVEGELVTLAAKASETFDFKPPPPLAIPIKTGAGTSFVPKANASTNGPSVPDEAPPALGTLHRQGDKRWLCIEQWPELNAGEAEARRLNATLVAKANP